MAGFVTKAQSHPWTLETQGLQPDSVAFLALGTVPVRRYGRLADDNATTEAGPPIPHAIIVLDVCLRLQMARRGNVSATLAVAAAHHPQSPWGTPTIKRAKLRAAFGQQQRGGPVDNTHLLGAGECRRSTPTHRNDARTRRYHGALSYPPARPPALEGFRWHLA